MGWAQSINIPEPIRLQKEAEIRQEINQNIDRFCPNLCELINIETDIEEEFPDNTELGFEALNPSGGQSTFRTVGARVTLQIDEKVGLNNRKRLEEVLQNKLAKFTNNTSISWKAVRLPQIGEDEQQASASQSLIKKRLLDALEEIIATYCPNKCFVGNVEVDGKQISSDQASSYPPNQTVYQKSNNSVFLIDAIKVEISIDEQMAGARRTQIEDLMKSKTRFYEPINFNFRAVTFPSTHAEEQGLGNDPYGLEKLRQMLIMFRDLAGTKEILSKSEIETETNSSATQSKESNSKESSTETNSSNLQSESLNKETLNSETSSSSRDSLESSNSSTSNSSRDEKKSFIEDPYVWGGVLLALLIVIFIGLRFVQARKDAQLLSQVGSQSQSPSQAAYSNQPFALGTPVTIGAFEKESARSPARKEKIRR